MYFSLLSVIFVKISLFNLHFRQDILSLVVEGEFPRAKNRQIQKWV